MDFCVEIINSLYEISTECITDNDIIKINQAMDKMIIMLQKYLTVKNYL